MRRTHRQSGIWQTSWNLCFFCNISIYIIYLFLRFLWICCFFSLSVHLSHWLILIDWWKREASPMFPSHSEYLPECKPADGRSHSCRWYAHQIRFLQDKFWSYMMIPMMIALVVMQLFICFNDCDILIITVVCCSTFNYLCFIFVLLIHLCIFRLWFLMLVLSSKCWYMITILWWWLYNMCIMMMVVWLLYL